MHMRWLILPLLAASMEAAEIDSGPKPGQIAPAFKVQDMTGRHAGKAVDYLKARPEEPTLVVWLTEEGWSRPTARFLRAIDAQITKQNQGVYQVVIRLTGEPDAVARQLPRAQQSLQLASSALTYYPGAVTGPEAWRLDPKASVTVVLVHQGKVRARFAEAQVNETHVPLVWKAIEEALK